LIWHRFYNDDHLKRLVFIRRCRELGFSLEEIKNLLGLVDTGEYSCEEVKLRTETHLKDVQQKIRDLKNGRPVKRSRSRMSKWQSF